EHAGRALAHPRCGLRRRDGRAHPRQRAARGGHRDGGTGQRPPQPGVVAAVQDLTAPSAFVCAWSGLRLPALASFFRVMQRGTTPAGLRSSRHGQKAIAPRDLTLIRRRGTFDRPDPIGSIGGNRMRLLLPTRVAGATRALMPALMVSSAAVAATQEAVLEEIVVTAERRETALQDTPISIIALSAEALEQKGVEDLQDMAL